MPTTTPAIERNPSSSVRKAPLRTRPHSPTTATARSVRQRAAVQDGVSAPLLFPPPPSRAAIQRTKSRARARHRWVLPEDCRTALPRLEDDSVALILTDPPYFIDRMGSEWNHRDLRSRVKAGVVGGLPVGMKFDPQQGGRLYEFLAPIATEWMRVLKPGGFALCFSHPRLTHRTTAAIEDAGFEIRDLLAWKHEGQAKAFTQEHFVRRRNLPEREKARIIRALSGRKTPQLKPQLEFPGTLIPCPKPKERFGHMTAKPVNLLRHLIRIFCAPGANTVVLDPFAGSGSSGVAARLEGRGFIGFEIDSAMAKTAEKRIEAGTG